MRSLLLVVIAGGAMSAGLPAASSTTATPNEPSGRIAYSARYWPEDGGDNWEIFVRTIGVDDSVNLTNNPRCNETSPAWSHDGQWIAFACAFGPRAGIYAMRDQGGGRRPIVTLPNWAVSGASWGPADSKLAFARGRSERNGAPGQGIWSVNADGSGLRRLSRGRDGSPTWSADGRRLAFDREVRGGSNVLRIRANGSRRLHIAKNACCPAWSPDGRQIAFVRNGSPWIMNPGGDGQRRLVRAPGDGVTDLDWSPDGRYLAYYVYCCREGGVYAIAPDGTSKRRLLYGAEFPGIAWGPNP